VLAAPTVAFATVSYGPDRDRCALLCRSMEVFAPTVEHWVVVEGRDLSRFRSLQGPRTTLVTTEEVLPLWLRRVNLRRIGLRSSVWLQARGRPVRGWLVQQLAKLAVTELVSADAVVLADSDLVLMRPFNSASVIRPDGHVRLYAHPDAIDERLPKHVRWHRSAERLLGLEPMDFPMTDYIAALVPWKRANVAALLARIEATTGRHWLRALAAASDVSEYVLYGRFVAEVLGEDAGQYVASPSLSRDYTATAPLSDDELAAFIDGVGPGEIAVSITAKAGMRPADYVEMLERRWAKVEEWADKPKT
jgi:uncharacterized protein DUF6492